MSQRQDLVNQILANHEDEEQDEETLEMLQDLSIPELEMLLNGTPEET